MTNLYRYLNPPIRHPKDIALLREKIVELGGLYDAAIQYLYEIYSEECYAAGWIAIGDGGDAFRTWLLVDDDL